MSEIKVSFICIGVLIGSALIEHYYGEVFTSLQVITLAIYEYFDIYSIVTTQHTIYAVTELSETLKRDYFVGCRSALRLFLLLFIYTGEI